MHAGSLLAALASYLDARANDGEWFVRIENIDPPREQPGADQNILATLEQFGFEWDGQVGFQRDKHDRHAEVAAKLVQSGLAYYCQCSRRALRAANQAARRSLSFYPGTCRGVGHTNGAIRVRVSADEIVTEDRLQGTASVHLDQECGDFVIWRRDDLPAYQLAVVVDDADDGITDVVRGIDLADSTPRQAWLQQLLGVPTPRYVHVPIVVDKAGIKLAKQTGAAGLDPNLASQQLWHALGQLRQDPPQALASAPPSELLTWGIDHWRLQPLAGLKHLAETSVAPQQNPLRC